MSKSIRSLVESQVKFDIDNGVSVMTLGYEQCNDYAQTVTNILNVRHTKFYRFETVARYIRAYKARNTVSQETQGQ